MGDRRNVPFGHCCHWFHHCNQFFWSQSAVYDPFSSSVEFVLKCGVLLILVAIVNHDLITIYCTMAVMG